MKDVTLKLLVILIGIGIEGWLLKSLIYKTQADDSRVTTVQHSALPQRGSQSIISATFFLAVSLMLSDCGWSPLEPAPVTGGDYGPVTQPPRTLDTMFTGVLRESTPGRSTSFLGNRHATHRSGFRPKSPHVSAR